MVMRQCLVSVVVGASALLALMPGALVWAEPPLQLPWPTGVGHYIWGGGYTYGCGTHVGDNSFAFDFQLSFEPVTATAAGVVTDKRTDTTGLG